MASDADFKNASFRMFDFVCYERDVVEGVPEAVLDDVRTCLSFICQHQQPHADFFDYVLENAGFVLEMCSCEALKNHDTHLPPVFAEEYMVMTCFDTMQASAAAESFQDTHRYLYYMARGMICRAFCVGTLTDLDNVFRTCWAKVDGMQWRDLLQIALFCFTMRPLPGAGACIQHWTNRFFVDHILSLYLSDNDLATNPAANKDLFHFQRETSTEWETRVVLTLDAACFARVQQYAQTAVDLLLAWKQWSVEGDVVLCAAASYMLPWPVWKRAQHLKNLLHAVAKWARHICKGAPGFVLCHDTVVPRSALARPETVLDVLCRSIDVAELFWRENRHGDDNIETAVNDVYKAFRRFVTANMQNHDNQFGLEYRIATRLADLFFDIRKSTSTIGHHYYYYFESIVDNALVSVQREFKWMIDTPESVRFKEQVQRYSETRVAWISSVLLYATQKSQSNLK